ncbi:class I SAM-dependent DNA methyltransferase [Thalassolituus sp. ST750PaO-4]|nr:class I SAM-dependent DNA methyltransferase [Thalassolituus sp. ST750PaO-4]
MDHEKTEAFINRWKQGGGTERANYQLFLMELCELLQLPKADPAGDDTRDNAYVFERRVIIKKPDGSENNGFIDLYKRDCFVLEAKQSGLNLESSGWDKAMLRAHNQADQYARALPADEGRPPFIIVTDVGRSIELYSEFSRSGATYTPYPDARSHRIGLTDLRKAEIQERLRTVWLNPLSLDPSRHSAKVTRDIADQLAKLAKSLEGSGYAPQLVADFMMRALFTMFAEDVGLLPNRSFTDLLQRLHNKPDIFAPMLEQLWQTMNSGGFSPILESTVLKFNGGLFASAHAIPLNRDQMELLLNAAKADWRYVEPAIFGTLLERALNPRERHKLGAHYTPRAYVERLVLPTVIEPLRDEWQEVQTAALTYEQQGKHNDAVAEVRAFHKHLCDIRILDPACGSGNFLYVTLEHMKRLEGEVLNLLHDLGESQGLLELEGVTVDPHQFLGLEINPRAARIAEMVLWIGYLQWHFRTHGKVNPPEPVLRDFHNIENRDALITYDQQQVITNDAGIPQTRWDGITYKPSPITGEPIPDESAQVEQYRYLNPRKAEWPQADYIVGNPPFIGASTMRRALGDGYVDAVRNTWKEVPESADFVMHWWHIAAETVRAGTAKQFGFITTNSIKQTFNRRVVQAQLDAKNPLNLVFAIPDHPWVDAADGAAVRIAMTTGSSLTAPGRLLQVREENSADNAQDEIEVKLAEQQGVLFADLRVGANVAAAKALNACLNISSPGVKLHGAGFIVTPEEAHHLGLGQISGLEQHIRQYRNGRDLTQAPRGVMVIDAFGLSAEDLCSRYPAVYQHLLEHVKPERDQNKRATYRDNWWIFGEARRDWRQMATGLTRYIATVETMKHRIFQFLSMDILPDNKLVNIALEDASILGILSSRLHALWALATGSRLGVGNDSVYVKTTCFETFPFPDATPEQQETIRTLAERLDANRKQQQEQFPELTLTGMYNVLEKLRAGETLTDKEKVIHQQGLVSVLREIHDELDRAVFAAYGWDDLADTLVGLPGATTPLPDKSEAQAAAEEELLQRLVALNAQRAAEEANGHIRWLRPEYQNPNQDQQTSSGAAPQQTEADLAIDESDTPAEKTKAAKKPAWPKNMREQVAAVRAALAIGDLSAAAITQQFKGKPGKQVESVLGALLELGIVSEHDGMYSLKG